MAGINTNTDTIFIFHLLD
ncbi:hypothetical protein D022_3260A, partial [Vibrio parahaemolyticus 12310]